MSFTDAGWADLEALENINEFFKLLKRGVEQLKNNEFEEALSSLSDASTLMYISLTRTITQNVTYRHVWGIIVQFNLLVTSLTLSFLTRAKQKKKEARERLGGATALLALCTAFLNPMIRTTIEQKTKPDGYTLSEKDRYLLANIIRLNEIVREFKKQFEKKEEKSTVKKRKRTTRKKRKRERQEEATLI